MHFMYPYPQSVNPAVRSHLDAQTAFVNALSRSFSDSLQQVVQLNMQLGQALVAETTGAAQRMLSVGQPADLLAAAASHAQQLRSYQQQLSQLAAAAQVDLTRVTEHHGQETARTARALADEVARITVEQTGQRMREQEESMKSARDAFQDGAERAAKAGAQFAGSMQDGANAAGAKPDGQAPQMSVGKVPGAGNQAGNKGASQSH